MRIGLISDTHIKATGPGLPRPVLEALEGADLILHCGDLDALRVLDELEEAAPVLAVRGYGDPHEPGERLAERVRVVRAGDLLIGMIHDLAWPGPPVRHGSSLEFPPMAMSEFLTRKFGQPVDLVAFGDTHEEAIVWYEGIPFINPGSPTRPGLRHRQGELGTVAILEVQGRMASVEIRKLARSLGRG